MRLKINQKILLTFLSLFISTVQNVSAEVKFEDVEVTEEALIGDYQPQSEFKKNLEEAAKLKAIEEVNGTYLRKTSVVVNREAVSMDITSSISGYVTKVEPINYISPMNNNGKGIIKLKVRVAFSERKRDPNMKLELNINKNKFKNNEQVKLDIKTNFDARITIVNVYEDNSAAILFPNSLMTDNFVPANTEYTFPTDEMKSKGASLVVGLPKDKINTIEHIRVFAVKASKDKPSIQLFDSDFKENIYKFVDSKDTQTMSTFFERIFRKIGADEITDSVVTYTIVDK